MSAAEVIAWAVVLVGLFGIVVVLIGLVVDIARPCPKPRQRKADIVALRRAA